MITAAPLKPYSTIAKLLITVVVAILYVHYFFPQSWGFYTIESKVPLYNIYQVHNGIADESPLLKNNMSYGMGISLKGKMLYSELYNIIKNKELSWKILNDDSLTYILQHEKYTSISAEGQNVPIVGKFIITSTERPSYLDLKKGEQFHPLKQYILADIR